MDTSLQPTYDMVNDYISNYTNGNIDVNNRLRAINRAIEYVHRKMGFSSDETIFTYYYSQDNSYTDLPVDFDEPIALVYHDPQKNSMAFPTCGTQKQWDWYDYRYILQHRGIFGEKKFSTTLINGKKQVLQVGSNLIQGSIINAYNTTNLVSATGDTTNIAVDNNVFVNGGGSLSFTIDPTLGFGYAGILVSGFGIMSVQYALQNGGLYKVFSYLQSTAISNIELILESSPGNFYTFSATTQNSGLPFAINAWNRTQYNWQLVSITGSPDSQSISSYEFRYVEGAGFGSTPITYFRINDFLLTFPDQMDLVFYTQYKGTDTTGAIQKIILDSLTDIPSYMLNFPDLLNPVALRAAYILCPQLSRDKDWWAMYKEDCIEELKTLGKIYPRKRIVTQLSTVIRRP